MVVAERYPLFGQLAGNTADDAYIELNDFGRQVLDLLRDEPRYYGEKGYELKILASMVMPDHIHVAIQVLAPLPKSIGAVIRGFKSACTSLYKRTQAAGQAESQSVNGRKYATKGENASDGNRGNKADEGNIGNKVGGGDFPFSRIFTRMSSIWQADTAYYHERIIHGYDQIDSLIGYIKANPRRLWLKRANPDLFKIHQQYMLTDVPCTVLGNMFLAEHPLHAMVQCSRTLTQGEINAYRDSCLNAAQRGVIHVSAAIAEGEKQTCRALREAGYPLIILLTEGFPKPDSPHYKYYKPRGVYFEACAAGRLLLVEPCAEYFDRPEVEAKVYAKTGIHDLKHTAKRYRFLALNALAEKVAKI